MTNEYRERHVYFFSCEKCGKERRASFKKRIAKKKICRTCRTGMVNENQMGLFPTNVTTYSAAEEIKQDRGVYIKDDKAYQVKPYKLLIDMPGKEPSQICITADQFDAISRRESLTIENADTGEGPDKTATVVVKDGQIAEVWYS